MFGPKPPWHNQQQHHHPQTPFLNQSQPQQHPLMGGRKPRPFPQWGMGMHGHSQPFSHHHPPHFSQGMPNQFQPKKPSMFKTAFMSEDGKFDVGKTVHTVDQVMKTVNQVSPLVKQVGSLFTKK